MRGFSSAFFGVRVPHLPSDSSRKTEAERISDIDSDHLLAAIRFFPCKGEMNQNPVQKETEKQKRKTKMKGTIRIAEIRNLFLTSIKYLDRT